MAEQVKSDRRKHDADRAGGTMGHQVALLLIPWAKWFAIVETEPPSVFGKFGELEDTVSSIRKAFLTCSCPLPAQ